EEFDEPFELFVFLYSFELEESFVFADPFWLAFSLVLLLELSLLLLSVFLSELVVSELSVSISVLSFLVVCFLELWFFLWLVLVLLVSLLVFDWLALLLQPTYKSIVISVIPYTKIFFFIVLTSDIVINIILQNHTLNPYESYFHSIKLVHSAGICCIVNIMKTMIKKLKEGNLCLTK